MSAEVSSDLSSGPASGWLLVRLDADGVAFYERVYEDGEALSPNQRLLAFAPIMIARRIVYAGNLTEQTPHPILRSESF